MEYEECIVRVDGTRTEWRNKEGQLHQVGRPAVEWNDRYKAYYQNGKRHRLDGPAVIIADGYKEYWIEGERYSKEEFLRKTSPVKELTVAQICELLGYEVKIIKE